MYFFHTLIGFVLTQTAYAQGDIWKEYKKSLGQSGGGSGGDFLQNLAFRTGDTALKFITGGAVLAIMFGGIKMITSAGNDEGKESAKKIVMFAVGGLILAMASQAVIKFTSRFVESFAG